MSRKLKKIVFDYNYNKLVGKIKRGISSVLVLGMIILLKGKRPTFQKRILKQK